MCLFKHQNLHSHLCHMTKPTHEHLKMSEWEKECDLSSISDIKKNVICSITVSVIDFAITCAYSQFRYQI